MASQALFLHSTAVNSKKQRKLLRGERHAARLHQEGTLRALSSSSLLFFAGGAATTSLRRRCLRAVGSGALVPPCLNLTGVLLT